MFNNTLGYEGLSDDVLGRLDNLAQDPVQFSEFTHSPEFTSALEKAKEGDSSSLENLIRLRELSVYYLTQTLVLPQTADRHLSKYFSDLEAPERDLAVMLYSDFSLNLCSNRGDKVTMNQDYLSNRVIESQPSSLLVKRIAILLFHSFLEEGKFDEALAIKEGFNLQKNEIYYAIISACRSHNNVSYETLPAHIREYTVTTTSRYESYLASAVYICEIYNRFDISASDVRQLGIPKIVWEILLFRDFNHIPAVRFDESIHLDKSSTLFELVLGYEAFQQTGAHAIRKGVIFNYLSVIGGGKAILSDIVYRCGFDAQHVRQLIIQGLKYEYEQGRNMEVLQNACVFYNISLDEVCKGNYLEHLDEEKAWMQIRDRLVYTISNSEKEDYATLIALDKTGINLDSVPLEYIPQVVDYIIKLVRTIYDNNIVIELEEGAAVSKQRRNWLSDFKWEFSKIFSGASEDITGRPRMDAMWKEVLSWLDYKFGLLRQDSQNIRSYKIVGNETNPLENLYFDDKRRQLKRVLSESGYEYADEICALINELYFRHERGMSLAVFMSPKDWLDGAVLQSTYQTYIRLIDELVDLGLGTKIKTTLAGTEDFDSTNRLSHMYPVFGLGKIGFTKLAEQDPDNKVYGFEFWTRDPEGLMRQTELRVGSIAPSWTKEKE